MINAADFVLAVTLTVSKLKHFIKPSIHAAFQSQLIIEWE